MSDNEAEVKEGE